MTAPNRRDSFIVTIIKAAFHDEAPTTCPGTGECRKRPSLLRVPLFILSCSCCLLGYMITLGDDHQGGMELESLTERLLHSHLSMSASTCKCAGERAFRSKNSEVDSFFLSKKIKQATCRKLAK